ncbi:MAG: glutamyl-tRNA reductase [Pedosphaera sp. Tous-C6FEB]|nr:MAG: glutamyl-tRNA reductase [Pedosphaera sp. Tous-C6FEB]
MPIVALGLSHRTAPVTVRERFAFAEATTADAMRQLRASGVIEEAVILSTCNRVEIYAATSADSRAALAELRRFLLAHHNYTEPLTTELYELSEPHSVEHLFKVAAGLDSMVLGETEILGQLKQAYDLALQHQHTGRRLNKAFQSAFNVAKKIRTETNIQRGSVSVASVAVELAEKIFDTLTGRTVMVIGAGDTSEKTARALLSRGAKSVIVSNRSHDRAVALAGELGGRAVHFDAWDAEFAAIDIIISSTSAPHYVLTRAKLTPLLALRYGRPLLLVDIAVPRDIEPEVNFLDGVYLYNVDDLQSIADDYLKLRREELSVCEKIIQSKTQALLNAPGSSGSQGVGKVALASGG